MTIDSVSNIVTVLYRAMTIRNAVIHNSTPFNIIMTFFIYLIFKKMMLMRLL